MRKVVAGLGFWFLIALLLPVGLGEFEVKGSAMGVLVAEASAKEVALEGHGKLEAGHGGHEKVGGGISPKQWKKFIWWTVNFLILVAVLYKFAKDPIVNLFRARKEAILNEYEDLMAKKREAERRYAELQEKLKGLEEEAKRLMEVFREQGERERERIIAEAKENAERIKQQAELYIQQEVNKARAELQREVAEMAVKMAEELIRKNITLEDHKRLFNEFIEKVERVH